MNNIIALSFILICCTLSAQNSEYAQIVLKNGASINANKIKTLKKSIRYRPACKGCLSLRFIKLIEIDAVTYNLKDTVDFSKPNALNTVPFNDSMNYADTIHFINTKNKKTWCLFSGKKVTFATSSDKYRGYVRYINDNQIGFSRKRKLSKVDSLSVISCNDIGKFKIKRRTGARIGGTFLKLTGGFAVFLGIGASATLINDVPELIVAVTTGGIGMYYLGEKATTKKIIIGSKWQVVE